MNTDLSCIKVGDTVAAIRTAFNREDKWIGTLHKVERVSEKRFMVHGDWVNKEDGRAVTAGGGYYYVLATPEMLAEDKRKKDARQQDEALKEQFHNRPEYKLASAILYALEDMTHSEHPLDRLTLDEWALFHSKIVGEKA